MNYLSSKLKTVSSFFTMMLLSLYSVAQEGTKKVDINVDLNKGTSADSFMSNPIYWIIGGLLLVLLVFAASRGGSKE